MIPNFAFTDEVEKIVQTEKNNVLTKHYHIWKKHGKDNKINGKNLYDIECPDIYAGDVDKGNVTSWFGKKDRETKIRKKRGVYDADKIDADNIKNNQQKFHSIVVILESPHKSEYSFKANVPNPALGSTGTKLQTHIKNMINNVLSKHNSNIKNGKYRIILMNSIRFQCSLGLSPLKKDVRDKVFFEIWKLNDIRSDFEKRLESYNPKFIFNLCTLGDIVPSLNFLVQAQINKKYWQKDVELYVGYHPSCWMGNRKKVWNARTPYDGVINF